MVVLLKLIIIHSIVKQRKRKITVHKVKIMKE